MIFNNKNIGIRKTFKLIIFIIFTLYYNKPSFAQTSFDSNDLPIFSESEFELSGEINNISICPLNSRYLSFESYQDASFHDLYIFDTRVEVNIEGKNPLRVDIDPNSISSSLSTNEINWCPVKIHNKIWFAFVSTALNANGEIYLGNLTDINRYIRITKNNNNDYHPRWSPDGKELVFVSDKRGKSDIFLVNNVVNFIDKFELWNEKYGNNNKNVLVYNEPTNFESEYKLLTNNLGIDTYPAWSPTGKFLAYQTIDEQKSKNGVDLGLISFRNNDKYQQYTLTHSPNIDEIQPSWSNDGKYLAFYSTKTQKNPNLNRIELSVLNIHELDSLKFPQNIFPTKIATVNSNVKDNYYGPKWVKYYKYALYFIDLENNKTSVKLVTFKNKSEISSFDLIPPSDSISIRSIDGIFKDEYTRKMGYIVYKNGDYKIYYQVPIRGIFDKDIVVKKELIVDKGMKNRIFVSGDFVKPIYSGDASGGTIEWGSSFAIEYRVENISFLPFPLSFKISFGMVYLYNDDISRRIPILFGEALANLYLKIGYSKWEPFISLGIGYADFSQKESNLNPDKGLMFIIGGGMAYKLVNHLRIRPSFYYKTLGNNIDRSPKFNAHDSYMSFNLGVEYYF